MKRSPVSVPVANSAWQRRGKGEGDRLVVGFTLVFTPASGITGGSRMRRWEDHG